MAIVQVDSSKSDFNIYRILLVLIALVTGIGAQVALASGAVGPGIAGYLVGMTCVVLAVRPRAPHPWPVTWSWARRPAWWRAGLSLLAIVAGIGAFAASGGNRYRIEGVLLWAISMACWWLAWAGVRTPSFALRRSSLPAVFILLLALMLGAAFRYAGLADNPREMNSDQAEKLLDVRDVLNGTPYIFFERNTGREPWQFYWTVLLVKLFNLRPDFMALKIGTSLIGWLMLPAIFLLAREVFGTRTALIATMFAAVASWGVITARFGLRYPLAPCAVAWTMFFLVRGLKRNDRNSMLAMGVWLGIGLQGYTSYRFMVVVVPLVVLIWLTWALAHRKPALAWDAFVNGILAAGMAILVFMPLLRYGVEHKDKLFFRAATRLSDAEKPISGNPISIFAGNVKNVLLMFNFTHDEVWVANLPDRPAMDPMLGAMLVLGAAGAIAHSVRQRDPWPALIFSCGILMLLPSALSIAYPRENPSVVRTGGALPLLMMVCAIVPGQLINLTSPGMMIEERMGQQHRSPSCFLRLSSWGAMTALFAFVVAINLQRVFVDYPAQYCPRAQNASDIAREMDAFVASGHSRQNAWIVGYPHWVDTRAVGVWIGDITFPNTAGPVIGGRDVTTIDLHGKPGWFALNEQDAGSLQTLKRKYPEGVARLITGSQCAVKHFIVYTTP